MSLSKQQEDFLAAFADKGLQEEADIAARNEDVLASMEKEAAKAIVKAELEAQAAQLIEDGLAEFEATYVAEK